MSWIHTEDDTLSHLTVGGNSFGVPCWTELMSGKQRDRVDSGWDAAVSLTHPDGNPMWRHIVAVEDCIQAFHLTLQKDDIAGETFNIAMEDPFDYVDLAKHLSQCLEIGTISLIDPTGHNFCMDITKAKWMLGYRPKLGIHELIEQGIAFRDSNIEREQRTGYVG
jgi:nucleoside-diphosphate-sugar epimerase